MAQQACIIQELSCQTDQGKTLFIELTFQLFSGVCTGFTGKNGQGKSVLFSILAQQRFDSMSISGQIHWQCPYLYLPQLNRKMGRTIAECLGGRSWLESWLRIEAGYAYSTDYDCMEGWWHVPGMWQTLLIEAGLPAQLSYPVAALSEGQKTKLALCRLFAEKDHYLLLDEPSNHLDHDSRQWLLKAIKHHPAGVCVISHDRLLLEQMDRMLFLDAFGIHQFLGNYHQFKQQYDQAVSGLVHAIDQHKKRLQHQQHQQNEMLIKVQKRRQTGLKYRAAGSQGKMSLDHQKGKAEQSFSKVRNQLDRQYEETRAQLAMQQKKLEIVKEQQLIFNHDHQRTGEILRLKQVILPYGRRDEINFFLNAQTHVRIMGGNGSGKSTLLKTIHGLLPCLSGTLYKTASTLYLDQTFSLLNPEISALANLVMMHDCLKEQAWRNSLGQLGLRGDKAILPLKQLSGGEQLKVALLMISQADRPVDILLLDEPETHLDIASRTLVAQTIKSFTGAVLLVSHDDYFVQSCGITEAFSMES